VVGRNYSITTVHPAAGVECEDKSLQIVLLRFKQWEGAPDAVFLLGAGEWGQYGDELLGEPPGVLAEHVLHAVVVG
jgi:hypothetical protein